MQNVLADLAVESEAATALAVRLAAAVDAGETAFLRLAGAAAKFWVCKRTPGVVAEAMEVLGGNGILSDYEAAKIAGDIEAIYTYEGTHTINSLIVGRAITGVSAFV